MIFWYLLNQKMTPPNDYSRSVYFFNIRVVTINYVFSTITSYSNLPLQSSAVVIIKYTKKLNGSEPVRNQQQRRIVEILGPLIKNNS